MRQSLPKNMRRKSFNGGLVEAREFNFRFIRRLMGRYVMSILAQMQQT